MEIKSEQELFDEIDKLNEVAQALVSQSQTASKEQIEQLQVQQKEQLDKLKGLNEGYRHFENNLDEKQKSRVKSEVARKLAYFQQLNQNFIRTLSTRFPVVHTDESAT